MRSSRGIPSKIRIAVNSVHTTYVWDDDKRGSRGFGWLAGWGIGPYKSSAIIKDQYFCRGGNGRLLVAQMCVHPERKKKKKKKRKEIHIHKERQRREEGKKKRRDGIKKSQKELFFFFFSLLFLLLLLLFIMAEGGERRRRSIRLNCMGHFGRMMGEKNAPSLCIQDRQQTTTRKMREGVSQLDEKCRGGTPEGLTITLAVPLLLRGRRESVGTPGTFRHKKKHSFSYTGSVEAEEEKQEEMVTSIRYNTISTILHVCLYVYQGRRMLLGGSWEGGGLRSKDDRELDRICTHTTREREAHQGADAV